MGTAAPMYSMQNVQMDLDSLQEDQNGFVPPQATPLEPNFEVLGDLNFEDPTLMDGVDDWYAIKA